MASSETTATTRRTLLSDDELLRKAKAAKNGFEFTIRFEQRSDSPAQSRTYDSRTEAAIGLLMNLAWWSRGDRAQMRRLFERSALGDEFEEHAELGAELDVLIERAIGKVGDDGYRMDAVPVEGDDVDEEER